MEFYLFLLLIFMLFELITASIGTCGRAFELRGFIIGGNRLQTVQRNDFPWISALVDSENSYFCGGVLISKTRVLTAAHCIQPKFSKTALLPRDVRILLGVFDLDDRYEVGRLSVAVEEIRMHPKWNPSTTKYEGDIAFLQMEDPVSFNKFIQPICLISPNSDMLSLKSGTVIGYGLGSKDAISAEPIPKVLNVPIYENEDCFLKNPTFASISSRNTFCAGYTNGSGVCFGDSGSGLYVSHEKTQYLRGIVSASLIDAERKCDVNDLAIFSHVSNYYDWITDGDDFLQSLSVQKMVTKAVETTTTVKTELRFDLAAEPEEKQLSEIKFRNEENLMRFNIEELDYDFDVRRK